MAVTPGAWSPTIAVGTISDLIAALAAGVRNHGAFVSRVAHLLGELECVLLLLLGGYSPAGVGPALRAARNTTASRDCGLLLVPQW